VLFWRDDDPLPASKAGLFHYHRCEFPKVVDLLRNEAPVFLFSMDLVDGVMSALMSGVEAVGDGDLQALITWFQEGSAGPPRPQLAEGNRPPSGGTRIAPAAEIANRPRRRANLGNAHARRRVQAECRLFKLPVCAWNPC
jgi:hypothetical protein